MALRANSTSSMSGFSLIEILVVLAVFSVIGGMTAQVVSRTANSQEAITNKGDRLAELHLGMQIIQRDIIQIAPRKIRDELGDYTPVLAIGSDGMIELTRSGWRNPMLIKRSELQRVTYITQGTDLYRAYWTVLDRGGGAEPVMQKILSDISNIEFFGLDLNGEEHTFWPIEQSSDTTSIIAIILRIEVKPFGIIERIWPVPNFN